jgi:hypothetical protein
MTSYQSEDAFDLKRCLQIETLHEQRCDLGQISMGLRRYVGLDLNKALRKQTSVKVAK